MWTTSSWTLSLLLLLVLCVCVLKVVVGLLSFCGCHRPITFIDVLRSNNTTEKIQNRLITQTSINLDVPEERLAGIRLLIAFPFLSFPIWLSPRLSFLTVAPVATVATVTPMFPQAKEPTKCDGLRLLWTGHAVMREGDESRLKEQSFCGASPDSKIPVLLPPTISYPST